MRGIALLVVLAGAGCAAPDPGPVAEEATRSVRERAGSAPRWRSGAGPGMEEDARVRGLLSRPLDEAGAVEVALVRNRHLQEILDRAIAAALEARAGAEPGNPVADFAVRWPHGSGGPIVDAGLMFGLLDLLRLPGRGEAADLEARAAALEAAEEILGVVLEVRTAWVDAVAARQRAALDEDLAEAASIAAEMAGRQHGAGTLPLLDADRHRVFRDEMLLARDRSRTDAAAALERLVRALGLFGEEARIRVPAVLPPPEVPEAPAGDLERRAVERRVDLERARVGVVAARLAAGLDADERYLPDVEAGVAFERDGDGSRSTGPAVSVGLPLSGRGAAMAGSSLAAARAAEDRLYDLAVRVRSEVREAVEVAEGARAVAERYRDAVVPRRAAMVEETQLLYNGMLVGVYDLLAEKREELRARREAVDAQRDWWLARIRLDAALGGDSRTGGK
jgi:outer membrane protein TolC